MSSNRTRRKRRWLSPGCLIPLVALLVLFCIGSYFTLAPVREAKQLEQQLNHTLAPVPEFVPAANGAIPAARLEKFLNVRARLLSETGQVQQTLARIQRLETVENESDISAREGLGFLKDAFGFLAKFLAFQNARNNALMQEGMGLGEYFYIYVAAYGSRLCPPNEDGSWPSDNRSVSERLTRELAQILRNQLMALETTPGEPELVSALQNEIDLLTSQQRPLPWLAGVPPALAASLTPFRQELDQYYCETTRELELKQKNRNLGGFRD